MTIPKCTRRPDTSDRKSVDPDTPPGYARGLFGMRRHSQDKVAELTARRMKRRAVPTKPDAPDVAIAAWERVLHSLAGFTETTAALTAAIGVFCEPGSRRSTSTW